MSNRMCRKDRGKRLPFTKAGKIFGQDPVRMSLRKGPVGQSRRSKGTTQIDRPGLLQHNCGRGLVSSCQRHRALDGGKKRCRFLLIGTLQLSDAVSALEANPGSILG